MVVNFAILKIDIHQNDISTFISKVLAIVQYALPIVSNINYKIFSSNHFL